MYKTHRIKGMAAILAAIMVCGVLIAGAQGANVPEMINYQGYLEVGGVPEPGPKDMKFRIYDQDVGGNLKWGPETHSQVGFDLGYFSVMLGDAGVPVEAVDLNGPDRWLEIEIAPFTGPLTPRIQLTSVPYAHRVATVDGTTGGTIDGNVKVTGDLEVGANSLGFRDKVTHDEIVSDIGTIAIGKEDINGNFDPDIKVGIGTTTPQATLEVNDAGAEYNPNLSPVGYFGTDTPGKVALVGDASHGAFLTGTPQGWSVGVLGVGHTNPEDWAGYFVGPVFVMDNLGVGTMVPSEKLEVAGNVKVTGNGLFNGNVGIGTESPQYTLDVDGDIRASGTIHGTIDDNHVAYKNVSFSGTEYIVNTSWVKMYTDGTSNSLKIENPTGSGYQLVCFHAEDFVGATGQALQPGDVTSITFSGGVQDIRLVSETNLLKFSGVKYNGALRGHVIYNE